MNDENQRLRRELDEAYRQLEQTASRLLLINQAGMLTTSTHDLRTIGEELLASILESVFAGRGLAISYSEDGSVFDVLASAGLEAEEISAFEGSDAESTALWIASLRARAMSREEILADEEWESGPDSPSLAVYVPLTIEGRLVGALVVGDKSTGEPYDAGELSFLANLGHHAAAAISHARLYGQMQKRLRDLDTLLKVSREITSTLDLDRILRAVVTMASALADLDYCAIGIQRGGRIEIDAVGGEDPGKAARPRLQRLLDYVAVSESEVSASVEDLPEGEGQGVFREFFTSTKAGSFWGMALKDDQGVLGAFGLVRSRGIPGPGEQELIRIMANQATVAIRNAELYQQVPFIGFLEPILEKRRRLWQLGRRNWKMLSAVAAAVVLLLLLVPLPYRTGGAALIRPGEQLELRSPHSGVISEILAVEGDLVEEGDPVAYVHSLSLELQYREARGELERARNEEASFLGEGDVAAARLAAAERSVLEEQVELLERELEANTLRAPFRGVVLTPHLEEREGARISSGEMLCQLGVLDRLRVEIELPERDWQWADLGQPAHLKFYTFAERTFDAQVERLSPVAEPQEKGGALFTATVFLDDLPEGLLPGMTGVGRIDLGTRSLLWHLSRPVRRFFAARWWR